MKKGINAWAKELKHNEGFAKKYEGVKTVEDIINVAKTQGYDINKKDLKELDLDAVAGGNLGSGVTASMDITTAIGSMTSTAMSLGDNSSASASGAQTMTQSGLGRQS